MMKTIRLFSFAALALALAACSNDIDQPSQKSAGQGIPFSATISMGNAPTRVLTEDTETQTIKSAWQMGEKVALIHGKVVDVMVVDEVAEDGQALISGELTGNPADGDAVTVVYPAFAVDTNTKAVKADLLAAQDGTLESLSTDLNLRESSGAKLKVGKTTIDGQEFTVATFAGAVYLANQIAIVKFSLTDAKNNPLEVSEFVIKDASIWDPTENVIITVTPSSDTSELYVAMPSEWHDYTFEATAGSDTYIYINYGNLSTPAYLDAGIYYQSPLTMSELVPATVTLDKTTLVLEEGESGTLKATITPGNATYRNVIWLSDNESVATVDEKGKVTAVASGWTYVRAYSGDFRTFASCMVSVSAAPIAVTGVSLDQTKLTFTYGDAGQQLTATVLPDGTDGASNKVVTWTTSNKKVATVVGGLVTPVGAGTCTITVTTDDGGYEATCAVTVNKALGSIIGFTDAGPLEKIVTDAAVTNALQIVGDGKISYSSSVPSVATVDGNGTVSILSSGTTVITATVTDGKNYTYAAPTSATYTVNVTGPLPTNTVGPSGGYADGDDPTTSVVSGGGGLH